LKVDHAVKLLVIELFVRYLGSLLALLVSLIEDIKDRQGIPNAGDLFELWLLKGVCY
jgi:hypothetical protein